MTCLNIAFFTDDETKACKPGINFWKWFLSKREFRGSWNSKAEKENKLIFWYYPGLKISQWPPDSILLRTVQRATKMHLGMFLQRFGRGEASPISSHPPLVKAVKSISLPHLCEWEKSPGGPWRCPFCQWQQILVAKPPLIWYSCDEILSDYVWAQLGAPAKMARLRKEGTSLAVQWLRLHFPMQGAQAWSLIRELRSHIAEGCGQN